MIDGRSIDQIARDDAVTGEDGRASRYRAMDTSLGRWTRTDPIGYTDGMNAYQFVRSNPARYLDPFGLQTTSPTTKPAAGGTITWGSGDNEFEVEWAIQDTTGDATHGKFGTRGPGIFKTIKVKKGPKCACDNLLWIQYTEARKDGQVYTPPGGFPWQGIDRYPAGNRPDREPYTFLPDEQEKVNQGNAYGGRVKGMYDPSGFDSTFVDWAASGGTRNWGQYSVVTLMCIKDGKAYSVGSYVFEYTVDAQGNLTFSGRSPTQDDLDKVRADFEKNNPEYLDGVYGGDIGMMRWLYPTPHSLAYARYSCRWEYAVAGCPTTRLAQSKRRLRCQQVYSHQRPKWLTN